MKLINDQADMIDLIGKKFKGLLYQNETGGFYECSDNTYCKVIWCETSKAYKYNGSI